MNDLRCRLCAEPFQAIRPDKKWCSNHCAQRAGRIRRHEHKGTTDNGRNCQGCGVHFSIIPPNTNRRYCSTQCSAKAARELRRLWARREYQTRRPIYERKRKSRYGTDTIIGRLRRRHPDIPNGCEACGESRIIEIAHKPQFKRNGAWRGIANTKRHMFWVLCPTCHKLLDREICSPTELGLT